MTSLISLLSTSVISMALATTQEPASASIDLTIEGMRSEQGHLLIALYDSAEGWNTNSELDSLRISAGSGEATAQFSDLPAGDYAIAVFHDANDDGRFNMNDQGIPMELYAFSNNVFPQGRRASFDEAVFEVKEGETNAVSITLRSIF